jgi:hypothetical protein
MLDHGTMDIAISVAPARRFSLRITATFDDKSFQIFSRKRCSPFSILFITNFKTQLVTTIPPALFCVCSLQGIL